MRPAPDQSRPTHPRQSGAASSADLDHFRAARANAATELRHAGSLRRDLAAGILPRGAAISAIRDCLRHARMCRAQAKIIARGLGLAAVLTLAACAQSPDAIAPVSMSGAFDGMSCQAARSALIAERQTLASLDSAQRSAVAGDAVGVLLIGVPVSSLTGGDKAGLIAASKGKVLALETRVAECG